MKVPNSIVLAAAIVAMASTVMAKDVAVVAGATGKSGRAIVEALVALDYDVRAMARNPDKAGSFGDGVTVVMADVTKPETLAAAVAGADYVLSTIGAVPFGSDVPENIDYKGVAALVDAAKAAGVKQFIHMTSIGAGSEDPNEQLNKMFQMILMWKGKGEEHLRQSGMDWTIVRPGGLTDCEPGKEGLKVGKMDGEQDGRVCRADAGAVMVAAIGNPAFYGKTISVIGDKAAPVNGWITDVAALPKD